jgi:hypothetical protein
LDSSYRATGYHEIAQLAPMSRETPAHSVEHTQKFTDIHALFIFPSHSSAEDDVFSQDHVCGRQSHQRLSSWKCICRVSASSVDLQVSNTIKF